MTEVLDYKQFDRSGSYQWVTKLKEKKEHYVLPFLEAINRNDPQKFVDFVENAILEEANGSLYTGSDLPSLQNERGREIIEFTPGHMKAFPDDDLVTYYGHLKDLPLPVATSQYFWGAFTLDLIRKSEIKPLSLIFYDPVQDSNLPLEKLVSVCEKGQDGHNDEKNIQDADRLMRRAIRSLFAPGLFRGAPEMYSDCSLAKAWWCGKIGSDCAQRLGISENDATASLNKIWNSIAIYLAGRLTVAREPNNIASLVLWAMNKEVNPKAKEAQSAVKEIGELASYTLISFHDPKFIAGKLTA